jgi:phospholipid transport system substrate-binding protein
MVKKGKVASMDINRSLRWALAGLFSASVFLLSMSAFAGAPTEQTRATVDKVLSILKNQELRGPSHANERRDQLRAAIKPRFDFTEMAKRSLGSQWTRRSPQEQQEFTRLFTELLENSYLDQIESYNGEKIAYGRENIDKDYAEVATKVVSGKGEEFSVNYNLRSVDGDWKVYDVVIENISLVNNYRSQFNRILAKSSFDELLKKLQAKAPELSGPKTRG